MKILPALTTIFNWRSKLNEIKALNLNEVALFLTCVKPRERREIYEFLKNTKIREIPFVHIRKDVQLEEINYLIEKYNTKIFNIHTKREYSYPPDYQRYKDMIYIENTFDPLDEDEIREFAGICLDLAHLENSRLFRPTLYRHNIKIIGKFRCGCNHISPAKNFSLFDVEVGKEVENWNAHILDDFSQLDYLVKYPKKYFGKFIALEMENTIKEQLKIRDYVSKLLTV